MANRPYLFAVAFVFIMAAMVAVGAPAPLPEGSQAELNQTVVQQFDGDGIDITDPVKMVGLVYGFGTLLTDVYVNSGPFVAAFVSTVIMGFLYGVGRLLRG